MTTNLCDEITCQRVGTLAAYGWTDYAIADALLLSVEQIAFAKTTDHFRANFARYSSERAEKAITRAEGWDMVEDLALQRVAQAMEYNSDPRFALQAARVANQAHRRVGGGGDRVINAENSNKTINLSLNVNFVNGKTQPNGGGATLEIKPREVKALPKRQADIPTPQAVSNLLAPAREKEKLRIAGTEFLEGLDFELDGSST